MNVTINLAVVLTQAKFDARISITDWHISAAHCEQCSQCAAQLAYARVVSMEKFFTWS